MSTPLACSLSATSAHEQVLEWKAATTHGVTRVVALEPNRVELELGTLPGSVEEIVRLAQREAECCPFFRFTLRIESSYVALVITVDDEAVTFLQEFVGAITSHP